MQPLCNDLQSGGHPPPVFVHRNAERPLSSFPTLQPWPSLRVIRVRHGAAKLQCRQNTRRLKDEQPRTRDERSKCLSENFLLNFNSLFALSPVGQSAGGQSELQTSSDTSSSRNQQAIQSAGDVFGRTLRSCARAPLWVCWAGETAPRRPSAASASRDRQPADRHALHTQHPAASKRVIDV